MDSLTSYFESDFHSQRQTWEKTLSAELKLTNIKDKTTKNLPNGSKWQTLSMERHRSGHLESLPWKKASNTYFYLEESEIPSLIKVQLEKGVRNFFFYEEYLTPNKWNLIRNVLETHQDAEQLEIFILGNNHQYSSKIKLPLQIISGESVSVRGGDHIQELGFMAWELINHLESSADEIFVGVYVDSLFFQSIAKVRAARLVAQKILQESGLSKKLKIVALTNFENWTLYERYSNMLRNEVGVAAAYIGGADHIQSSGYNAIHERESLENSSEHRDRSLRMAHHTGHILSLESYLGMVQDASHGSYHLENLTEHFCQEAWAVMQRLSRGENLDEEINKVREEKLSKLKTRKDIVSGINDFPDVEERLNLKLKKETYFRRARIFEELRLRMEKIKAPEVFIGVFGDPRGLNARLNFGRNYFELLGLKVHIRVSEKIDSCELEREFTARREEILVLCAQDEDYTVFEESFKNRPGLIHFILGKHKMPEAENLFSGQNVFEVLQKIVATFEEKRS